MSVASDFAKQYADLFYAVTDEGRKLPFTSLCLDSSILLTLRKEAFESAQKLRALPALGAAHAGDAGYYIIPRAIGHSGDFQIFFREREDTAFAQGKPVMSCYGIKKDGMTVLVRVERNYFYYIETAVTGGDYSVCALYDFTAHDPVYDDIRLELIPLGPDADYNDMARAEREVRLARDEIIPLAEKCAKPAVEYARKYPLIRIRMGWKPSPATVLFQTEENEPEMFVACDFRRVREIADELRRQGVEGAELQLVGWNRSGHDGRFPQLFPADPRLGGNEGLRATIDYVKSLGYRISTHTNTIDTYPLADTFEWDDVVVNRNGHRHQWGHYSGGYAYHVCLPKQWKNTVRDLPPLAAYGENGLHFTDVVSIEVPDDCHAPGHPSSTANSVLYAQRIIEYTRGLFGGFSSEGAMDFSLKNLDFALYVCFGDGFGNRRPAIADRLLPFFEIAYHGFLLYNPTSPTVNYPLKGALPRLDFFMRGGRPAMYYYSRFRTGGAANWMGDIDLVCRTDDELRESVAAIKRAAEEYAPQADRQLVCMDGYDFLENGLQVARYADGSRMVGNYTENPVVYEGHTVPPLDFIVIS